MNYLSITKKIPLAMRVTLILLCLIAFQLQAEDVYSQKTKISLDLKNTSIEKVLQTIEEKSDYYFLYNNKLVNVDRKVSVRVKEAAISDVLDKLFASQDVEYQVEGNQIILSPKEKVAEKISKDEAIEQQPQQKEIRGKVSDASGHALPGVTVIIKGTSIGTTTDSNGNFVLRIPSDAGTLQFSFIGMKTQEIPIAGKTTFNVVLEEEATALQEVVAVGYGTMRKSDLTGSAVQIKTEALTTTITGNALASLQGKAPGIAVFTETTPGAAPNVRIRGNGSISASNEPLYVVDGFPLMAGDISDINPNDIESMEVLKDASSTAIYGSRGANGVVLVTTKKGLKGNKNLTINITDGFQTPGRLTNLIKGEDFINFMNAGYTNQGSNPPFSNAANSYSSNTDWEKEILQNSMLQDYNITFDGNANNTNYLLSVGFYNQDGLVPNQGYQKYSFRTNLLHNFNKWFTVGTNSQFTYTIQDINNEAIMDVFRYGWATEPVKNDDGSFNIASTHNTYLIDPWNPVLDANQKTNQTTNNRFLGDMFAEFQILKDLKFRTDVGVDIINSRNYQFVSSQSAKKLATKTKGNGSNAWNKGMSKITENVLTYSPTWDKHRLTLTGVYSWQDYTYENASLSGSGFENDETGAWDMSLADKASVAWASTKYSNRLISFTGRFAYAFADKYLFTTTSRWDGSSRFGSNNKWGYFPSVGLGWRISQESFLQNNKVITYMKLRGSFGITGNQEIGNYKSLPQITPLNYTNGSSLLKGFAETIGNSDLKWERTEQWDGGIDLTLWNRLNVTFDYYNRHTSNLLYDVPIPSTSGFSSLLSNVGEVSNHGIEVSFDGKIVNQKDFKLNASINFSYNDNKIDKLYGNVNQVTIKNEVSGLARILKVGEPVDAVYARKSLGIIKTQEQLDEYKKAVPATASNAKLGDEMYADLNEDGSISSADYICLGSIQPKYYYGLNIGVEYKKFGINIFGNGGFKYASIAGAEDFTASGSIWDLSYANMSSYLLYGENQILNNVYIPTQYAYKRMWSTSNPGGAFPTAGAHGVYLSDRTNGDWKYFMVKNIQLNYDFTALLKTKNIKKLTVNLNFQNFFTFANQRGYNPINGDVTNPWPKSIILGINAKF